MATFFKPNFAMSEDKIGDDFSGQTFLNDEQLSA